MSATAPTTRQRGGSWILTFVQDDGRGQRPPTPRYLTTRRDKPVPHPYMPRVTDPRAGFAMLTTDPFDPDINGDKLREECGVFGIWGAETQRR